MSTRRVTTLLALAWSIAAYAPSTLATDPSECDQAAQFIGNAARARDFGITREEFLARMQADLEVIRAFPPELRWFAETEEDEEFLLHGARDVFDHPLAPEAHAMRFARACVSRTNA
ncbi:MAG: hypothetical protein M3Z31_11075 [Pseudomonadota bacterium]|nr:hypothetical protein [Pseudomonadota bacterium]